MKRFAERCRLPTRHTSTPKGRFVLRADAIRPYRDVSSLYIQKGAALTVVP